MTNQNRGPPGIMHITDPGSVLHLPYGWGDPMENNTCMEESPELSNLIKECKVTLSPTMLYADDGALLTSGLSLKTMAKIVTMAFEETHKWLSQWGMKTDQVKNELMHFTKTKNCNSSPTIHIPGINPRELKEGTPAKSMMWAFL